MLSHFEVWVLRQPPRSVHGPLLLQLSSWILYHIWQMRELIYLVPPSRPQVVLLLRRNRYLFLLWSITHRGASEHWDHCLKPVFFRISWYQTRTARFNIVIYAYDREGHRDVHIWCIIFERCFVQDGHGQGDFITYIWGICILSRSRYTCSASLVLNSNLHTHIYIGQKPKLQIVINMALDSSPGDLLKRRNWKTYQKYL